LIGIAVLASVLGWVPRTVHLRLFKRPGERGVAAADQRGAPARPAGASQTPPRPPLHGLSLDPALAGVAENRIECHSANGPPRRSVGTLASHGGLEIGIAVRGMA
jgi:hypothetical protein